jgi:hypothetical protein
MKLPFSIFWDEETRIQPQNISHNFPRLALKIKYVFKISSTVRNEALSPEEYSSRTRASF